MKRLKNDAIYALVRLAYALLAGLPLGWTAPLGRALGVLAYVVAGRERRRAMANLARAYPRLGRAAHAALVRRMFVAMGRSVLEFVCAPRMAPAELERMAVLAPDAGDALQRALGAGRGVIFVSAHYGNWELMAARVAAAVEARVSVLAKPSYDRRLTELVDRMRAASRVHNIWVDQPAHLRRALRALRDGGIVGVLVDQPVSGAPGVPFFGERAPTSRLVDVLARLSGAAVVAGFISRDIHGDDAPRHVIEIEALAPRAVPLHERGTAAVERAVRRAPSQWAWSLDRWRSDKARIVSRVEEGLASEK